jgi:hypothetical protein
LSEVWIDRLLGLGAKQGYTSASACMHSALQFARSESTSLPVDAARRVGSWRREQSIDQIPMAETRRTPREEEGLDWRLS